MEANNGLGNNVERDDWETPKRLFEVLNTQYKFTLDCCANKQNAKVYFIKDFLKITKLSNGNICWLNPPFSKAKEMFTHFFRVVKKGIAIYRGDNLETEIWQDIIFKNADWIFIFNKRVCYEHKNRKQTGARFGSILIGIGLNIPKNLQGKLIKLK